MPFILQTPRQYTTIGVSSGWSASTSLLTSSSATLWSFDKRSAITDSFCPFKILRPRTTLESPRLATYSSLFEMAPTRQHDPTDAIWGLTGNSRLTNWINSSSVALNAFLNTSADKPFCSDSNSKHKKVEQTLDPNKIKQTLDPNNVNSSSAPNRKRPKTIWTHSKHPHNFNTQPR